VTKKQQASWRASLHLWLEDVLFLGFILGSFFTIAGSGQSVDHDSAMTTSVIGTPNTLPAGLLSHE